MLVAMKTHGTLTKSTKKLGKKKKEKKTMHDKDEIFLRGLRTWEQCNFEMRVGLNEHGQIKS